MFTCLALCVVFCFFKQKTAYEMRISDWSSDVCSSGAGEGGADFGVGHAGEAWVGSDRTILPGVGSQACRKSRAARLSLVGRGARLNVGANVLGGKIKEEASAAGRRRGTFAPKGLRTRAQDRKSDV